jgi:hypothetical protein
MFCYDSTSAEILLHTLGYSFCTKHYTLAHSCYKKHKNYLPKSWKCWWNQPPVLLANIRLSQVQTRKLIWPLCQWRRWKSYFKDWNQVHVRVVELLLEQVQPEIGFVFKSVGNVITVSVTSCLTNWLLGQISVRLGKWSSLKKCKQLFEYQHLLLLSNIWWSKF